MFCWRASWSCQSAICLRSFSLLLLLAPFGPHARALILRGDRKSRRDVTAAAVRLRAYRFVVNKMNSFLLACSLYISATWDHIGRTERFRQRLHFFLSLFLSHLEAHTRNIRTATTTKTTQKREEKMLSLARARKKNTRAKERRELRLNCSAHTFNELNELIHSFVVSARASVW